MIPRYIIILLVVSFPFINSCKHPASTSATQPPKTTVEENPKSDSHTSVNSLDWAGTYIGTLPCADCEGIKTLLKLNKDFSYQLKTQYKGKDKGEVGYEGIFKWNDAGNTIMLTGIENSPNQYFVHENTLMQLDKDGKKITGEFPERYILKKITIEEERLTGRYWKLIELMGKPISDKGDVRRDIHIVFNPLNQSVNGFAGCNSFFGSYELAGGSKLSFLKMGSTRMACMEATEEDDFLKMIGMVDNYYVTRTTLFLYKEKSTPLAKFELIMKK